MPSYTKFWRVKLISWWILGLVRLGNTISIFGPEHRPFHRKQKVLFHVLKHPHYFKRICNGKPKKSFNSYCNKHECESTDDWHVTLMNVAAFGRCLCFCLRLFFHFFLCFLQWCLHTSTTRSKECGSVRKFVHFFFIDKERSFDPLSPPSSIKFKVYWFSLFLVHFCVSDFSSFSTCTRFWFGLIASLLSIRILFSIKFTTLKLPFEFISASMSTQINCQHSFSVLLIRLFAFSNNFEYIPNIRQTKESFLVSKFVLHMLMFVFALRYEHFLPFAVESDWIFYVWNICTGNTSVMSVVNLNRFSVAACE